MITSYMYNNVLLCNVFLLPKCKVKSRVFHAKSSLVFCTLNAFISSKTQPSIPLWKFWSPTYIYYSSSWGLVLQHRWGIGTAWEGGIVVVDVHDHDNDRGATTKARVASTATAIIVGCHIEDIARNAGRNGAC